MALDAPFAHVTRATHRSMSSIPMTEELASVLGGLAY
jgi:hypothetical protein